MNVRKSALDCVEQLARMFPIEVKAAGLDEPLRQIVREHSGLSILREGFTGTRRRTSSAVVSPTSALTLSAGEDFSSELRDNARRALTYIENRPY